MAQNVFVLSDGQDALDRLVACVDSSAKSIVVNMFIWRDDPAGNRIGQALLGAADRGVEITITKDKLGAIFELGEENRQSFFHKDYDFTTAVKQRVINAYSSKPDLMSWTIQQPNDLVERLRNHENVKIFDHIVRNDHSKFTIIDGEYLFVGGMNFEERIISRDANGRIWKDYLLECRGKQHVMRLKERLSGGAREISDLEFVLNDHSGEHRFEIKPCVLNLLNCAKETCRIEMAYFGDADVTAGLIDAAKRGIEVEIVVPAWANIQNERNLKTMYDIYCRTNGRASIYLSPDMLHSKMMDIDGRSILIGSANFNRRALNQFAELNVLISGDSRCARDIRNVYSERRDASKKVTDPEDLNYRKIKEWCEYVFG